jgi:hypothetical protein
VPAVLFQTDPESDPDLRTELPIDRATPFGVETVGQEVAVDLDIELHGICDTYIGACSETACREKTAPVPDEIV